MKCATCDDDIGIKYTHPSGRVFCCPDCRTTSDVVNAIEALDEAVAFIKQAGVYPRRQIEAIELLSDCVPEEELQRLKGAVDE